MGNNSGLINIDTMNDVLKVEIRNSDGQPVINKEISMQELQIADCFMQIQIILASDC